MTPAPAEEAPSPSSWPRTCTAGRIIASFHCFWNKTRRALLARRIEKVFTKEEILTLYFNTVSFGENLYGIEAASLRYFNKKTTGLNVEEAAVLTGMLKANTSFNPRLYPENALKRRNVVLRQMERYGYLQKEEADSLSTLPLKLQPTIIQICRSGKVIYGLGWE
ncbi:MAG: transglycosylase domain-containing protein [Bacteroidales bacterium]|nr:transglycosylase domain-containing protein [Bacteroidales bacterium]